MRSAGACGARALMHRSVQVRASRVLYSRFPQGRKDGEGHEKRPPFASEVAGLEMSQFHLRPDAARRGPTRLRPQDVASPTRGPTLELLRSHVRPCRFATCFSAARAKADAARRAGPPRPTADPPPPPSHVRHGPTRPPRATCRPFFFDKSAGESAATGTAGPTSLDKL